MTDTLTLSIDAMGGDHGLDVTVPAAIAALKKHPSLHLILVGLEEQIQQALAGKKYPTDRLSVVHASELVAMDESPAIAVRTKKDSSMRVAINLVKDGQAAASVSAGNTGALMATAKFVLKTVKGIDRPAIISRLPSMRGQVHMLDLGANIDCKPEYLFQFAMMGSALIHAVEGKTAPKIALLNVGEEEVKGIAQVKDAAELISASSLNYVGFVEGDDIYSGDADVDVVVCDGFVGNIALKTSEGLAKMFADITKSAFTSSAYAKMAGAVSYPVLNKIKDTLDPRHYNGASFIGLNNVVIKSHGSADAVSFANAIDVAIAEAERNVPEKIREVLATNLA